MTTEQWKDVVGYEGFYEVSDAGLARSVARAVPCRGGGTRISPTKMLRPFVNRSGNGYEIVGLSKLSVRQHKQVHRLVLEAFVGPCPDQMQACHNNGNSRDNRLTNLRWATSKENHADKRLHGTTQGGERCGKHKLKNDEVLAIRSSAGETLAQIGSRFGVSASTVSAILRRKTWRHI